MPRTTADDSRVLKNGQAVSIGQLRDQLVEASGGWPKRVAHRLFVRDRDGKIVWLDSTAQLFAWIQSDVMPVKWFRKVGCVTKEEFWAELQRTVEAYDEIANYPHEPMLARTYYACSIPPKTSSGSLDELVSMFGVESDTDRELIKAMALTMFWGGRAGARPVFVITSDQGPGSGKTTLADVMAHLVGGSIDASPKDDVAGLKTRLLSNEAVDKRVVLVDNVKASKFSWADFEALITRPVISGRALYIGESRRSNMFNWIVTLNGVSLSADIAQRSVVIKLRRTSFDGTFRERVFNYVDDHRSEIIGDCLSILEAAKPQEDRLTTYSRWATWEDAILDRLPIPMELQKTILDRQNEADDDSDEACITRMYIREQLALNGVNLETGWVEITASQMAKWVNESLGGQRMATNAACRKLQDMIRRGKVGGIEFHRKNEERVYWFKGAKALGIQPQPFVGVVS